MQWQPGQSGNPLGRPKGSRNQRPPERLVAEAASAITSVVITKALAGDIAACRLVLDRVLPTHSDAAEQP